MLCEPFVGPTDLAFDLQKIKLLVFFSWKMNFQKWTDSLSYSQVCNDGSNKHSERCKLPRFIVVGADWGLVTVKM